MSMGESASFVYNETAMTELRNDITALKETAEQSLKAAQETVEVARAALAEANVAYEKAMDDYQRALVVYENAMEAYEKALAAYEKARSAAMAAFSKAKQEGKTTSSAPSLPSPPTPPTPPTPPSKEAVTAAQAALAAAEQSVNQIHSDIEALNALVTQLVTISTLVRNTEEEAVHVLTNEFFKLYQYSGTGDVGNKVADAITTNAVVVQDGYKYITAADGSRVYTDLFADEKLSMEQYLKLGERIGADALVNVMNTQGCAAEMTLCAVNKLGKNCTLDEIRETYKTNAEQTYNSSAARIHEVMASATEAGKVLYTDGVAENAIVCPIDMSNGSAYVSSEFGQRWGTQHNGIDIVAKNGTPISAMVAGEVVAIETGHGNEAYWGGYGNYVKIKGNDGKYYFYAHMSNVDVKVGDTVGCGATIGAVGNSGDSRGKSGGYHLHFEVREVVNGTETPCNPRDYVDI